MFCTYFAVCGFIEVCCLLGIRIDKELVIPILLSMSYCFNSLLIFFLFFTGFLLALLVSPPSLGNISKAFHQCKLIAYCVGKCLCMWENFTVFTVISIGVVTQKKLFITHITQITNLCNMCNMCNGVFCIINLRRK